MRETKAAWQTVRTPEVKNWGHGSLPQGTATREGCQLWEGSGGCMTAKVLSDTGSLSLRAESCPGNMSHLL